ncbi:flagellar motor protein [Thiobacter aerophilum]|uniref:Flagellar motor protein n=1 Tax=Thiobacter aerophilum TaxID=3121275 RepID=A0ABV0EGD4_9BURK
MDFISLIGILLALAAVLGGQILEGGHVGSLMQITAFVIVIGGTAGAVMLQSSLPTFLRGMRMVKWVFVPPPLNAEPLIQNITQWSSTARKGGLLALEPLIDDVTDPFTKKGLQMLVDGAEPETLRDTLQVEIDAYEDQQRQAARVWESAGGYAPTIGILGAVLGLIHVMENLSDPSKLGGGIAVAFVATVYGVGSANLLFLPIANKLKSLIAREITLRHMLVEGLISVANGENPRLIERKLRGYLA